MVVGTLMACRVIVEHAGAEGADHEVVGFKGLVDRRGHVQLAGDRAEVVGVEDEGVVAPVPSDHVERVVVIGVRVDEVAGLDADLKVSLLVPRERELGELQVALAHRARARGTDWSSSRHSAAAGRCASRCRSR